MFSAKISYPIFSLHYASFRGRQTLAVYIRFVVRSYRKIVRFDRKRSFYHFLLVRCYCVMQSQTHDCEKRNGRKKKSKCIIYFNE